MITDDVARTLKERSIADALLQLAAIVADLKAIVDAIHKSQDVKSRPVKKNEE